MENTNYRLHKTYIQKLSYYCHLSIHFFARQVSHHIREPLKIAFYCDWLYRRHTSFSSCNHPQSSVDATFPVLPRFGPRLAAVRSISSRNLLLEAPIKIDSPHKLRWQVCDDTLHSRNHSAHPFGEWLLTMILWNTIIDKQTYLIEPFWLTDMI